MDQELANKKICFLIKSGEFSQAFDLIRETKPVNLSALKVIIAASNACYHNAEKCEVDKLEPLINMLIFSIDTLEESHLTIYFQSIFHIIKLLCKKERFEDLIKMEAVIIPTFSKNVVIKDIQQAEHIYTAIINQISSAITCLAKAKNTSYNKYLLEIFKIILKAKDKLGNPKNLLSLAQTCLCQIHHLEAKNDMMITFYNILLEILASNFGEIIEYTDTNQMPLVEIFSDILTDMIESTGFENASLLMNIVEIRIQSNFKQEEYLYSHLIFKSVVALFPANTHQVQDLMDNAKLILHKFRMNHKKLFYNILNSLDEPLLKLLLFYKNSGLHIWNQLPQGAVLHLLKFLIEEISCHSMLCPKKCPCGCSITKNYYNTSKIGCQMASLLKCYVDHSKDLGKDLFSQLTKWLYFFYGVIKKLKEAGCQKWTCLYCDLACYTYKICVVLYRAENAAHKRIDLCFLKNSLELEGLRPEIISVEMNTFLFSALCEIECKNENWLGAMGLAAMHCLLYTQNSNNVFHNWWIRSKIKAKEDSNVQQQTLLSVLCQQNKQLSNIFDVDSLLTTDKKIELLTFELTKYKAVWKSKASMMAAFEYLSKIADIPTIAEVVLTIYGDGDIQIHIKMFSVLLNVIRNFEAFIERNETNSKVRLALAVLYYYHFKAAVIRTADENLKEMETTMQVMESVKQAENIEPVPKDANDECDIVSAYSNLQLTKFMDILKSLNICVDHIGAIMNDNFEPDILKSFTKLLTKIGFEYRLHCFSIKSLQAFDMSMRCAQKISDNEAQLFALSFLIESADVKKNFVHELINKGDQLAKLLEGDNDKGTYSKTLAIYYIYKCKAFLYGDPEQSYAAWQKADALCALNEEKDDFQVLRADLYIILYKLTKNCEFIEGEHASQPMTLKLHLAYDIIIEVVSKNIFTSYELCVVFDAVYEITKVYNLMRLPRDLRAYSKNSVLLTQKLVLPMRCVSFLIQLAQSDLATCKFDHCMVKLNGIDDIFCVSQSRPFMVPNEKYTVEIDAKNLEDDVDRCTDLIQELVLDFPVHSRQYSPASPTLTVEGFKFPQFMRHEKTCICFMCLSLEFQRLLLDKFRLNALLNMYEKDQKVAEEFVVGALTLYKTINRNFDYYRAKISKLIPEALIPNSQDTFLEPYGNILHDYSYHMSRNLLESEALKMNTKLIQVLRPYKMKYVYLYHDALQQRLAFITMSNLQKESTENDMELQLKTLSFSPNQNILAIPKTPVGRTTTVTVMVNGLPTFSPPKRRCKRSNIFGVTNDSKEKSSKTSEMVKPTEIFTIPKLKTRKASAATPTPSFSGVETPKIQIFTDDEPASVRKYSRKRLGSVKKQAPSMSHNDLTKEKLWSCEVSPKQCPVISGSSKKTRGQLHTQKPKESAQTQNPGKALSTRIKRNLGNELLADKISVPSTKVKVSPAESDNDDISVVSGSPEHEFASAKTKVFLEKLKSSTKKVPQAKPEKAKRTASTSELKKNVMKEFEESESSSKSTKSTGAIRKSARNKVL